MEQGFSNPDFTEQERRKRYKESRRIALLFNIAGPVVFVLLMVLKVNITLLTILLLLYPLLGVFIIHFYSSSIALAGRKEDNYSSIFFGMFVSALFMIRPLRGGFQILSYDNLWAPFISISALMLIALYYCVKASRFFKFQILFAVPIAFCFGYGSTLLINTTFDGSKTQVFTTPVTDHYIEIGKYVTYHLLLTDHTNHDKPIDASVNKSFYDDTAVGSNVDVHLNEGFFNIAYFFVTK